MAGVMTQIRAIKARAAKQSGKIRSVAAAKKYASNFSRRKSTGGNGG